MSLLRGRSLFPDSTHFVFILEPGKFLIGFYHLFFQLFLESDHPFIQFGVAESEDLCRQDRCVLSTIDRDRCYGDPRRHLEDGEGSIKSVKRGLDGHPDDR